MNVSANQIPHCICIFDIIAKRISSYTNNLDLLPPKLQFLFRKLKYGFQEFIGRFLFGSANKAADKVVVV